MVRKKDEITPLMIPCYHMMRDILEVLVFLDYNLIITTITAARHHDDDVDDGASKGYPTSKMTETSYLSMAASSSGSEASDLLNKSTLSDTTELTASNFVLLTTSKQHAIRRIEKTRDETNMTEKIVESDKTSLTNIEGSPTRKSNQMIAYEEESLQVENHQDTLDVAGTQKQASMKDASPSLRSRISSSPASLRKFKEDLVNSRMKRQLQREEDAKRRLSVDSGNSIPFMQTQLESLRTDTAYNRQRLPPPFTQPSQLSQDSNESISRRNSPAPSVGGSQTDTTSFVNMDELDDILGTRKSNGPNRGQSSMTARRSSIDRALGLGNQTGDISALTSEFREGQTTSLSFLDKFGCAEESSAKSSVPPDSVIFPTSSPPSESGKLASNSNSSDKDDERSQASLLESPPLKLNSTSGFRSKMTPTKLSSSAKRVVNPQSIFSPAKNTRSATKKRQGESEEVNDQHIGTSLFGVTDSGYQDAQDQVSTEIFPTNVQGFASSTKSVATSVSGKSDETASLGDIEDLLGSSARRNSSDFQRNDDGSRTGDSVGNLSPASSARGQQEDFGETASLGEINEILGTTNVDTSESVHSVGGKLTMHVRAEEEDGMKQLLGYRTGNEATRRDASISGPNEIGWNTNSNEETTASTKEYKDSDQMFRPISNHQYDPNHNINASIERDIANKYPTSDTLSPRIDIGDKEGFTSPTNDEILLSTPPELDLSQMSPGVNRLLSQSNGLENSEQMLSSNRKQASSTNSSDNEVPIRLVPNSHIKPTPTKLPPTPRRVLNPNNPTSPARNTRSASRNSRSPLTAIEALAIRKRSLEDSAIPEQLFQDEVTAASNKRRRSSMLSQRFSILETNQGANRSSLGGQFRPPGILSSKKKTLLSQRSVAFGSPQAAEYHIGSPSVSLTPMPKGRAKELFRLPTGAENNRTDDCGMDAKLKLPVGVGPVEDQTMEIESDMNLLVDKITVDNMNDSPELSPIAKNKSDTGVYDVSSLACGGNLSPSSNVRSFQEKNAHQEQTVELETGMDGLLANTMKHSKFRVESPLDSSMDASTNAFLDQENSIEMTDAETIASFHSRKAEKYTTEFAVPMDGQKLDFSIASEAPGMDEVTLNTEGGQTVDLEANMTSLINVARNKPEDLLADVKKFVDSPIEKMMSASQEIQTVALEGDMTALVAFAGGQIIENQQEDSGEDSMSLDNSTVEKSGIEHTVELENNMTSLLSAAGNNSETNNEASFSPAEPVDIEFSGDTKKEIEIDDVESNVSRSSRRKSLASHSFTLHQEDQLQLSAEDVMMEQKSMTVDKSVSFCDTTEFITSVVNPPFSESDEDTDEDTEAVLTQEEISAFADAVIDGLNKHMLSYSHSSFDSILLFAKSTFINNSIVYTKWHKFMKEVIKEIERVTEPENAAKSTLVKDVESNPEVYSVLFQRFTVDDNDHYHAVRKSFNQLASLARKIIDLDCTNWFGNVLTSCQQPIGEIPITLDNDIADLNKALLQCEMFQDTLVMINNRKASVARRKSFLRRQTLVGDLEAEIKAIEEEMTCVKSELSLLETKENQFSIEEVYHERDSSIGFRL